MTYTKYAIIVDLDGTISSSEPYTHILDEKWDWEEFERVAPTAPCNENLVKIIHQMARNERAEIIVLTARPYFMKDVTMEWLEKNQIGEHYLVMASEEEFKRFEEARPGGYDAISRAQARYKTDVISDLKAKGYRFVCAFEDNPIMGQALEEAGVRVSMVEFGE